MSHRAGPTNDRAYPLISLAGTLLSVIHHTTTTLHYHLISLAPPSRASIRVGAETSNALGTASRCFTLATTTEIRKKGEKRRKKQALTRRR